jgi:MFS-type transporter involved in bile tolerance (Atg22 family)
MCLRTLGIVVLFLGTFFIYVNGVVVASFRGDQIVAVYALQWGALVLVALLIGAVVAAARHSSMRPWLISYFGLLTILLVVTIVSWHIIDDRDCPPFNPDRLGTCFNPQIPPVEK